MSYLQIVRHFNRNTRILLAISVLIGFCYFGIYTVIFNLYLLRLGYGPEFIGLINGVGQFTMAAWSLPAGILGRSWGTHRTLKLSYTHAAAMFLLLPLVEFVPATLQSGWLLVIWASLWFAIATWSVNYIPYMVSVTADHERQHAFAVAQAIVPLAAIAGSLAAGLIPSLLAGQLGLAPSDAAPYRYLLFVVPILYILFFPLIWSLRPADVEQVVRRAVRSGYLRAPFALLAAVALFVLLRATSEGIARIFFNIYLDNGLQAPTAVIGVLASLAQLVSVPAALAAPLLVARWGKYWTIGGGTLAMAACLLPMIFLSNWIAAGVGYAGVIALAGATYTPFSIFHQEVVEAEWQSTMSGVVSTVSSAGQAAIVLAGGYLIPVIGYPGLFAIAALLTAMGGVFFLSYFHRSTSGVSARGISSTANH
jgi:MFS family permease